MMTQDYLQKVQGIIVRINQIVDPTMQAITLYAQHEISGKRLASILAEFEPAAADVFASSSNKTELPEHLQKVDQLLQEMTGHFHNIYIWFGPAFAERPLSVRLKQLQLYVGLYSNSKSVFIIELQKVVKAHERLQ